MYISNLLIISLLSYCVSTFGHPNNYCSGYCSANYYCAPSSCRRSGGRFRCSCSLCPSGKHPTLAHGMYLSARLALLENIFLATNVYLVLLASTNLIQDKLVVIRVVVALILVVGLRAVLIVV